MGTTISLDARDAGTSERDADRFFALMHELDRQFSPFRRQSEVSRLAGGAVGGAQVSPGLREVLDLCEQVRVRSGGAFDIAGHDPEGRIDPSGLVKGWAIERGAALLVAAGWSNFCINAGGDVLTRGEPERGRPWRIGIRHPTLAHKVVAVMLLSNLAIATSGAYERGDHIIDPVTGGAPRDLISASVIGPSLTFADAYATALFVKGRAGMAWITGLPEYEAFAATANQRALWTDGCDRLLASDMRMDG